MEHLLTSGTNRPSYDVSNKSFNILYYGTTRRRRTTLSVSCPCLVFLDFLENRVRCLSVRVNMDEKELSGLSLSLSADVWVKVNTGALTGILSLSKFLKSLNSRELSKIFDPEFNQRPSENFTFTPGIRILSFKVSEKGIKFFTHFLGLSRDLLSFEIRTKKRTFFITFDAWLKNSLTLMLTKSMQKKLPKFEISGFLGIKKHYNF